MTLEMAIPASAPVDIMATLGPAALELVEVLVLVASSSISEGFEPSVKLAPHWLSTGVANSLTKLGYAEAARLYACFAQSEQVTLDGMVVVPLMTLGTMEIMLLMLRVPTEL